MNRTYCGAGVGILYAMVVVGLIAAKLAGHIAWSWPVVLSPIWVPVMLAIVIAVVVIALFTHDSANGENPFQ